MPNYFQGNAVSGSSQEWVRPYHMEVQNPITGSLGATFYEERAVAISGGDTMTQPIGTLNVPSVDPTESFPIYDPSTGAASGSSMPVGTLIAAIYSYYLFKAAQRDSG